MKSQAQVRRIKELVPEKRSCHDDTRSNLLHAAMESSIVISPPDSCLKDANCYFFFSEAVPQQTADKSVQRNEKTDQPSCPTTAPVAPAMSIHLLQQIKANLYLSTSALAAPKDSSLPVLWSDKGHRHTNTHIRTMLS